MPWKRQLAATPAILGWLCICANAAIAPPTLPTEPELDVSKYPSCQKEWITTPGADRNAKLQLIAGCLGQLDNFNRIYLKHFTKSVASYSGQLTLLDAKYHHSGVPTTEVQAFSKTVQAHLDRFQSIDAAGDFGDGYQAYYDYLGRYKADVHALTDAYNYIAS